MQRKKTPLTKEEEAELDSLYGMATCLMPDEHKGHACSDEYEECVLAINTTMLLRRKDIDLLIAGQYWLNDEIINFYMLLLRDAGLAGTRRRFCFLHFWAHHRVHGTGSGLRRQQAVAKTFRRMYNNTMREPGVSRQLDPCVQSTEGVAFVVNDNGCHWNTAVIDIGKQMVGRYDSGGWSFDPFAVVVRNTELALQTMAAEQQEAFETRADLQQLASYKPKEHTLFTGEQENGNDCGVFSLATLDWLTDGLAPYPPPPATKGDEDFVHQKDMHTLRRRFALELLKGKLLRTTLNPSRHPAPEGTTKNTHATEAMKYIARKEKAPTPKNSLWQLIVRFQKEKKGQCDAVEITADECKAQALPNTSAGTYCYVCAEQIDKDGTVFNDSDHKHKHFKTGKICTDSSYQRGWCKRRISSA